MTIDEAIEILQRDIDEHYCLEGKSVDEAHRLGIEALKTIKEMRHYPFPDGIIKLPSETEE